MNNLLFEKISYSPLDTEDIGKDVANYIEKNFSSFDSDVVFVALYGDVGAGKTVFTRGLCSVITPNDFVSSPTYALVNEYNGKTKVIHYDMYRISDEDDLESTGFYDYKNCIIVAEWCENIPYALPNDYIKIKIEKTDDEKKRKITCERIKTK